MGWLFAFRDDDLKGYSLMLTNVKESGSMPPARSRLSTSSEDASDAPGNDFAWARSCLACVILDMTPAINASPSPPLSILYLTNVCMLPPMMRSIRSSNVTQHRDHRNEWL